MKRSFLVWLVLLSLGLPPAFAGTVYVPLAMNETVDGVQYETQLWSSNVGTKVRRFSVLLLEENTNGLVRDDLLETFSPVGDLSTSLMTGLVNDGQLGMVEVAGAPQLQLRAELVAKNGDNVILSRAFMPVISSENLLPGGIDAHLQGLQRSPAGTTSSIGIINLAKTPNECSVQVISNNGQQFGNTFLTTMPPLSQRYFTEVLEALGQNNAAGVRAVVNCQEDFYPFGAVFYQNPVHVSFLSPSESLTSELIRPGEEPALPTVEIAGNFFNPSNGDSVRELEIPVEVGVRYKKITIEYDLFINRMQTPLFHAVTSLRRKGGPPLYFAFFVRGSNGRTILDRGDGTSEGFDGIWSQRTNYRVSLEYDADSRLMTVQARQAGQLVYNVATRMTFSDLSAQPGRPLIVILGQSKVFDGAYFPPWGWSFSNLKVQATPE